MGNLTRDPELKKMPNGTSVCNFSVATNRVWYDASKQKQEQVEYHNCVAFGKQADNITQYFHKGSKILVEGRLQTNSWDDKATGKKMYRTEIVVEKFHFTGSANQNNGAGGYNGNVDVTKPVQYDTAESKETPSQTNEQDDYPDYPDGDINPEDIPF